MILPASKSSSHLPLLDFLRATAAILVLFSHSRPFYFVYINFFDQPNVFMKLFYFVTGLGHEAVVIFFVLSGFLIGGSLNDSMLRGDFVLSRYVIARFVRIYTVYIPALIITKGIYFFGALLLTDPGNAVPWINPLFGRQNLDPGGISQGICLFSGLLGFSCPNWEKNPVLWSLGLEWALYLFAPVVIQLMVWKAAAGLRLLAIALVCAITATMCRHPNPIEVVFWFAFWFLGVAAYRFMRVRHVPLPVGLLGASLILVGMGLRHIDAANQTITDIIIAAGVAITIACQPLAAFPLAPRFFGWAAGFSYTLYAIHAPFIFLAVAVFRQLGLPPDIPPSPAPFMEFGVTIAICLLAAILVSRVTEKNTGRFRRALFRLCPPRNRDEIAGKTQQQLRTSPQAE